MLAQDRLCLFHGRADRSGNQVFLGHNFRDRTVIVGQKTHITVGDDAHQLAHIVHDRNAGDLVLAHQRICIGYQVIFGQRERVDDNAVFRALYLVHLVCLLFDAHIFVDDTDAAFTGDGDRHSCLGHGVHCRRHDRCVQIDIAGKSCAQVDHIRCYVRFCRDQQHVIECQPLLSKLFTQSCFHRMTSSIFPDQFCKGLPQKETEWCVSFAKLSFCCAFGVRSQHRRSIRPAPPMPGFQRTCPQDRQTGSSSGYCIYHTLFLSICQGFRHLQGEFYSFSKILSYSVSLKKHTVGVDAQPIAQRKWRRQTCQRIASHIDPSF